MKLRNILFAGVLCLLLCGPALIGIASWGGGLLFPLGSRLTMRLIFLAVS